MKNNTTVSALVRDCIGSLDAADTDPEHVKELDDGPRYGTVTVENPFKH